MSDDLAIRAEGLGKRYRRGSASAQHNSIRDVLTDAVSNMLKGADKEREARESFWALSDVSFDIKRGENVGIIGLNGAGKSTLLKLLSRITAPTVGTAQIHGRLGALLEVGTGFHQELTGRENVFLYGAILGMSRAEIESKFDAIVDFSEIREFIDTPVKRYSSGMYVRLAFAVAAHLDPDILLLDEVLAVGDFSFQRKCMDFARQLEQNGATILFVSHNMFSIKTMCERVIYLKGGKMLFDGPTDEGLKLYEADSKLAKAPWFHDDAKTPSITITDFELFGDDGAPRTMFDHGECMNVRISYKAHRPIERPDFRVGINRDDEVHCSTFSTVDDRLELPFIHGEGVLELRTPPMKLVSAMYTATISVRERGHGRMLSSQLGQMFHIRHPVYASNAFGVFHEPGKWQIGSTKVLSQEVAGERR